MKYLQNFEGFDLLNIKNSIYSPFFHKKRKIGTSEVEVEDEDGVEQIQVSWTGYYTYKGDRLMLKVGDVTNKGIIKKVINDMHVSYLIDNGKVITNPEELIVYKGSKESIERFLDTKKYNL